ncbi:MAG TPA: CHAT domain-containing protein [Polyangiaceae bacterium]|nr:CHAT domain-containing protein [Polyangiaceae bacterium]
MTYLDFFVEVRASSATKCHVTARSPRGECDEEITLPLDLGALATARAALHGNALRLASSPRDSGALPGRRDLGAPAPSEVDARDFGKALYGAIFRGQLAELFAASREYAKHVGKGLRVNIVTHDPALALVPWELLCSRHGDYLCLSERTPLVRYAFVGKPQATLRVEPPLQILGVLSMGGGSPLDLEQERARIGAALDPLLRKGLAEITWLNEPATQDLLEALGRRDWHVLHFAGHGTFDQASAQGLLSIASEGGGHGHLRATDLRTLLRDRPSLKMVFLNACNGAVGHPQELFSSTAALMAEAGVPAVLAMQFPISDHVATNFACQIYRQIAEGRSVEEAVTEARKGICVGGSLEWATPVLFMRSGEGAILQVTQRPSGPDPRPQGGEVPAPPPPVSPPIRPRPPAVMAVLALALTALGVLATYGAQKLFGPPHAATPPADAPAAAAPPASAPANAPAPYDWSTPCVPAAGAVDWVSKVRSALCDLESKRPAAAWLKLDELARKVDLADEARGIVSKHASRASEGAGQLLAQTNEPPAALTLSLDDGQLVTPNAVIPVNPGRRTLTIRKNGREVRALVVQVVPGALTTINVQTNRPAPEKPSPHGNKICDDRLNCVPL